MTPTRPRPSLIVEKQSQWRPWSSQTMAGQPFRESVTVKVDVYGPNPLVQELYLADRAQYGRSLAEFGLPPTLFNAGDLPLYLASGVDVSLLEQLPWVARPAAARATASEFAEILDTLGAPTEDTWEAAQGRFADDDGVRRYRAEVHDWSFTDPNERVREHLMPSARGQMPIGYQGTAR